MKLKRILLVLLAGVIGGIMLTPTNPDQVLPYVEKDIIDFHVHVAGLGFGDSGCFINEAMKNNYRFEFYLRAMGVSVKELKKYGDQIILKKISHAVILSLDGGR